MCDYDRREGAIDVVIDKLRRSEPSGEEMKYNYKKMVKMISRGYDIYFVKNRDGFLNRRELLYFDIIDRIINVHHDEWLPSTTDEQLANIIRNDKGLLDYCLAQVGEKSDYPYDIKVKFRYRQGYLREALALC
jgi:hypothetical protein